MDGVIHRHDVTEVFRSPLLCITDFRCRDENRAFGAEELSDESQLVFVRSGCFEREVRGRRHISHSGAASFFNRGDAFKVRHPTTGGDRCTLLTFRDDLLRELLAPVAPDAQDQQLPHFPWAELPCDDGTFLKQQVMLQHASAREPSDVLAIEETALSLARSVLQGAAPKNTRTPSAREGRHRDLAEAARALLLLRLDVTPGLDELSAALGCSPFHLARVFRAVTGAPLHQTLLSLRLRTALARLADGADDLTALALSLGFSSHGHFSTRFRRAFGFTPSAFRESMAGDRLNALLGP
jgi:AraC-like DNA-binding protein